MSYELTGTVHQIGEIQEFSSGFTKREFVVTTEDDYPQDVKFECIKDKCAQLDRLQPGQRVTIHFNVRGNEHNGRFYVNLQAWRIQGEQRPQHQQQPRQPAQFQEPEDNLNF